MIYLCSADDTAGRQCILAPPASLFLSLMLPRKGQPFPPERRNCSHTSRGVLQFRLPSAPQRYNTLDFPTENRVPTGMLLAPIGNPEPKELRPSGHLIYFLRLCIVHNNLILTLSRLYISHSPKTKNPTDFIFHGRMKSARFLYHCVKMCIAVHIVNLCYNQSARLSHFGAVPRYFHTA